MTHLYIEQNTGQTEEVNSSIISKLYELAISGDLDNTSDLKGRLHTPTAKEKHVSYLNENFDELYITADVRTLSFEDPIVENICITNWGSNGDITANQLNEVTNASTQFKNNTTMQSFNEFRYFTSVGNNYSFSGCTALQEITLPPAKTTIVNNAFKGCTSLQAFDFANITSVGNNSFDNCQNCVFSNIEHLTSIGDEAFKKCKKITSLEIPAGITLGSGAFAENNQLRSVVFKGDFTAGRYGSLLAECTQLTSVTFEQPVSVLPFRCFRKCSALESIDLSNVYSYRTSDKDPYYGGHFSQCSSLQNVTLSTHANRLEDTMFAYCSIHQITIPANVTEIGQQCFYACRNLTVTMLSTTPPTLTLDSGSAYQHFGMVPSIKVPAGTLSTYQNATGWSTFASIISESLS